MSGRFILIGGRSQRLEEHLKSLLCVRWGLSCRKQKWSSLEIGQVFEVDHDLLIADAVDQWDESVVFFEKLRKQPLASPSLAVVSSQAKPSFIELVSEAADDFLLWPTHEAELRGRLKRLCSGADSEVNAAAGALTRELGKLQLVGRDPNFVRLVKQLPKIAAADVPVIVKGETGTGKELVARALHHLGKRRNYAFVPVDCGGVPESLFENELFGHARGAFTDAHRDEKGLVEIADRGTLFLDEVDSLRPGTQAKLLRFLQERTFRRLGQSRFRSVDVNVVAATNKDLQMKVRKEEFRADLYFRLNILQVFLPPLRERVNDVELLARHQLRSLCSDNEQPFRFLPSALRKLRDYYWPGNVRELFNVVQRAKVLCEGRRILPEHIVLEGPSAPRRPAYRGSFKEARNLAIAGFEKAYVRDMLRKHSGNITRSAKAAGKERRSFGRLVKKYGIDPLNP